MNVSKPSKLETVVNTRRLTYNPNTMTFTTEASMLGWPVGRFAEEVTVVSARTGNRKVFRLVAPIMNGRNVLEWSYQTEGMTLIVLND